MSKRYKKNYLLDGWPIEDTESHSVLHTDDLVVRLNDQQARIDELESAITDALYGEKLDEVNHDNNGLLRHPDIKFITERLLKTHDPKITGDI